MANKIIGVNKMKNLTKNIDMVVVAFDKEKVRTDHFNGRNGIFKLSANIEKKDVESVEWLIDELQALPIVPAALFIMSGDLINICWYPQGYLLLTSKEEYLTLCLNFASYLDKLNLGLTYDRGSLHDDPVVEEDITADKKKYINPSFSEEVFSSASGITVYDFN